MSLRPSLAHRCGYSALSALYDTIGHILLDHCP